MTADEKTAAAFAMGHRLETAEASYNLATSHERMTAAVLATHALLDVEATPLGASAAARLAPARAAATAAVARAAAAAAHAEALEDPRAAALASIAAGGADALGPPADCVIVTRRRRALFDASEDEDTPSSEPEQVPGERRVVDRLLQERCVLGRIEYKVSGPGRPSVCVQVDSLCGADTRIGGRCAGRTAAWLTNGCPLRESRSWRCGASCSRRRSLRFLHPG